MISAMFAAGSALAPELTARESVPSRTGAGLGRQPATVVGRTGVDSPERKEAAPKKRDQSVVARADYERLQEQLTVTEDMLDEALAERGEEVA